MESLITIKALISQGEVEQAISLLDHYLQTDSHTTTRLSTCAAMHTANKAIGSRP